MSKDGTYRGGRKVRAGDKPNSLSDKIASGRSALVFESIDLEDEPSFEMDSSDFLEPGDLEDSQISKPSAYSSYKEVCYYGTHTSLKNKSQTYTVEGVNSDLRHYIPPLRRKSKCFSRSLETAKAVFKIFVYAFNNFALHKFLYPHLKSSFSLSFFI